MTKEKKITNKQGLLADPRKHYHTQGFTCDCKHCGVEFSQYHDKHVFCGEVCSWDYHGRAHTQRQCVDCLCVDEATTEGKAYVCSSCRKFRVNSTRTDITRRNPTQQSIITGV